VDIRAPPPVIDSSATPRSADALREVFVVEVRHNVVQSMVKERVANDLPLPATRLEIATQLTENYQQSGCIDGLYRFETVERARVFAILCLEFVQAVITRRLEELHKLRSGESFKP
jgi:hypothetical protein